MGRHGFLRGGLALLAAASLAAASLAGCTQAADTGANDYVQPATVEDIPGSPVRRVVLTALAAQRLDVRTQPVATAPGGGPLGAVPVRALVYDPEGRSWVYTNPQPL